MMPVACELSRILISETSDAQVIVLRELDGQRSVSIEIGIVEAMAIKREVEGLQMMRPLTHDLLINVIDAVDGVLSRVVVSDLVTDANGLGTYYGLLVIDVGDHHIEVDCRPSDGMALAVRTGCPVFVADHVLAASTGC